MRELVKRLFVVCKLECEGIGKRDDLCANASNLDMTEILSFVKL